MTKGELIKEVRALTREQLEFCCLGALSALDCRAGKLLVAKKPFIVVANDEPYFGVVYEMIRNNERIKGTWTPDDNDTFLAAMKEFDE